MSARSRIQACPRRHPVTGMIVSDDAPHPDHRTRLSACAPLSPIAAAAGRSWPGRAVNRRRNARSFRRIPPCSSGLTRSEDSGRRCDCWSFPRGSRGRPTTGRGCARTISCRNSPAAIASRCCLSAREARSDPSESRPFVSSATRSRSSRGTRSIGAACRTAACSRRRRERIDRPSRPKCGRRRRVRSRGTMRPWRWRSRPRFTSKASATSRSSSRKPNSR